MALASTARDPGWEISGFGEPSRSAGTALNWEGDLRNIWTDEKIEELRKLKQSGMFWKDIATTLCLTIDACKNRWLVINQSERDRIRRLEEKSRRRIGNHIAKINRAEVMDAVPESVWVERNARLNEPLSLTGWMLGDPVPSRSALAQREVRA